MQKPDTSCGVFSISVYFVLILSKKADQFPAQDAIYRFLNQYWRRFLLLLI